MDNYLQLIFHLLALTNFGFSIAYLIFSAEIPDHLQTSLVKFGGGLKFFTSWNIGLHVMYYSLCAANDVFGSNTQLRNERHRLQKARDFLFSSLAFPNSLFVSSVFWAIWAVDRELVFPKVLDVVFPVWLNHLMHTIIVPIDILELVIVPKIYPPRSAAVKVLLSYNAVYIAGSIILGYHADHWVYPIMGVLNWPLRVLLLAMLLGWSLLLYMIGETLGRRIWGVRTLEKPRSDGLNIGKLETKRKGTKEA